MVLQLYNLNEATNDQRYGTDLIRCVLAFSDRVENGGNSGERVLWAIYWRDPHVDRPTFGRRIDAIQKDFLAWHVTSEGLFSYFLKNLLGLPFGQLLKCSSDLILGSRGSAGISGLEWAAAGPT